MARQLDACCAALRATVQGCWLSLLCPWTRNQCRQLQCAESVEPLLLLSDILLTSLFSAAASPDPITQGNSNYDEIHYINVCFNFFELKRSSDLTLTLRLLPPHSHPVDSPLTSSLTKAGQVSRTSVTSGVIGATSRVLVSEHTPHSTPALLSLMLSCGSSPEANATEPATHLLSAMMLTAVSRKSLAHIMHQLF